MSKLLGILAAIAIVLILPGLCSSPAISPSPAPTPLTTATPEATPTPLPTPTAAPTATPTSTQVPPVPARLLADAGRGVFATSCAKCHGKDGEGFKALPLIGAKADIGAFFNTKLLFDFISTEMPRDAPGSLTRQDYIDVVWFLAVENGLVDPEMTVPAGQIESVPLEDKDSQNRGLWGLPGK